MRRAQNAPLLVAIIAASVAIVIVALHLYVAPFAGLANLEDLTIDARFHLRGSRAPASDRVVIIIINPHAITRLTAIVCPFIRPTSRSSFRSRAASMETEFRIRDCGLRIGLRNQYPPKRENAKG